MADVRNG